MVKNSTLAGVTHAGMMTCSKNWEWVSQELEKDLINEPVNRWPDPG